jgi:hypothetical protein
VTSAARRILAALVVLAATAGPAGAHDERAISALTVVNSVEPDIQGIEIRVAHLGAPSLVVRNESPHTITVFGTAGEPFLRIGPDGVEANIESPTTYVSLDPNNDKVPAGVDASAPAKWIDLSGEKTWSWFDPRLHFETGDENWQVPMAVAGEALVVDGGFEPLQGHGHFLTRMDVPPIEGLEIRLIEGPIPALFVRNETSETLLVRGAAGEPLLRIGPGGVLANVRSPSYYTAAAQTILEVPPTADPFASPRWRKLSPQPTWAWLEHRAVVPASDQERDALGDEKATVLNWRSPMTLGGRELVLQGHVDWIPPAPMSHAPAESPTVPLWLIAVGVGAVGVAAMGATRRRAKPA